MERIMLIMIVAVALVAIGGLLFVGVQQPQVLPVFLEQPVMQASEVAPGTVLGQAGGQIKFKVAPITDSTGGQIKFSMK